MGKELSLFGDFWNDVPSVFDYNSKNLFKNFPDDISRVMNGKCDFEELDDRYHIELEVPGIKKNEIEITLKEMNLEISWSRKRENKKGFRKKTSYERQEGSFTRSFHVEGADADKISASLKDGVLSVDVPKKSDYKPRLITIN